MSPGGMPHPLERGLHWSNQVKDLLREIITFLGRAHPLCDAPGNRTALINTMEDDWVVDSLIGFLETPLWKNPVDDFIEQHCIG